MSLAAWTFVLGLVVGIVFQQVWSLVVELLDLYAEERDRDDPRKPW